MFQSDMGRNSFYFSIFLLMTLLFFYLVPISTIDLSHYIALGLDTAKSFSLVTVDAYTYTNPEVNFIYPVLSSLIFASLYQIGGLAFTVAILGLCSSYWLFSWYKVFYNSQHTQNLKSPEIWNTKTLFWFLLSTMGIFLMYAPRCSLLASLLLLYSYIFIKSRHENLYSKTDYLKLFLVSAVWVNVHGSFLLLSLIIAWSCLDYILAKKSELLVNRTLAIIIVNIGALLNPYFTKVYSYISVTAKVSKERGLDEWFSPFKFDYPFASTLFFLTSLILIGLLFKNRKNLSGKLFSDPFFLVWLVGWTSLRNTAFIFLFLPIFLSFNNLVNFQIKENTNSKKYSYYLNASVIAILILLVYLVNPTRKHTVSEFLPEYAQKVFKDGERPTEIFNYLHLHKERIFNSWDFGSNLALERTGQYFIDARNIIFSDEVVHLYDNFLTQPDVYWSSLKVYKPKYFLIREQDKQLVGWLNTNKNCTLLIKEGPSLLYDCSFNDLSPSVSN